MQALFRHTAFLITVVAVFANAPFVWGGGATTKDDVAKQQKQYQAERDASMKSGAAKLFSPLAIQKADVYAKRGDAALKAGRFQQAAQAYRQARWQLPYAGPKTPEHVVRIIGSLRLRHAAPVYDVALSADGTRLATASADTTVRIWDMGNGRELHRLTGHSISVHDVAFSPDGKYVVSGGGDGTVRLWNVADGRPLLKIAGKGENSKSVNAVRFSPKGDLILSAWNDKAIRIYKTVNGGKVRELSDFRYAVNHVAFSPDGKILAAAGSWQVRLYEWSKVVKNEGAPAYYEIADQKGPSYHIAFSPDGKQFVRTYEQGAKVYNTPQPGEKEPATLEVHRFKNPTGQVNGQAIRFKQAMFNQDAKVLFVGANDGKVYTYDLGTKQLVKSLSSHANTITAMVFDKKRMELITSSLDHTIRRRSFNVVASSRHFKGHKGAIWGAHYSPDGLNIVSGGADELVKIWDATAGTELKSLKGHKAPITAVRYSPDGKLIASAAGDSLIKIWNPTTGQFLADLKGHTATVTAIAFSKDGKQLISGAADEMIKVWDVTGRKELRSINTGSVVAGVAMHPDGVRILSGHIDQTARIYDAKTGKKLASWTAHSEAINGVAFNADGSLLATCAADHLVKVWRTNELKTAPIIFSGHKGAVSSVAFRPNGDFVASAGADQIVKLWKLSEGSGKDPAQEFRGHGNWVSSVAFSKDGYSLTSGSVDESVRIWEITSRRATTFDDHAGSVTAVAASPDGKLFASAGTDRSIKIWDAKTGAEWKTLRGHTKEVVDLIFTPDSKVVISSGLDGNIYRWNVKEGKLFTEPVTHRRHLQNLKTPARMVFVSPDSSRMTIWQAPEPRRMHLVNISLNTGQHLVQRGDVGRLVSCVTVSQDGMRSAIGGFDGSVRLCQLGKFWDLLPGGDWFLFDVNEKMTGVSFAAKGKLLAVASEKGNVKIADVDNRKVMHSIKAHTGNIHVCILSPDAKRVATAGADNTIKLWDVATGKELRQWQFSLPRQITGAIANDLAFTSDSKHLISGNADTTLRVLALP